MQIRVVGDVNLRNFSVGTSPFRNLVDHFGKADYLLGGLEGCFYDTSVGLDYKPGWFHAGEGKGSILKEAGFTAMAMANNVTFGEPAIRQTIKELDEVGIAHSGAGMSIGEATTPAIFNVGQTRIGMIAYTTVYWPIGHAATSTQAGVATISVATAYQPHPRLVEMPGAPALVVTMVDGDDQQDLSTAVSRLRDQVDVVLVFFHWGVSGSRDTLEYQKTLAHASIESGADAVFGTHPHVIQRIEVYKERPIFYSMGNCVFGWERMDRAWIGLLAMLEFDEASTLTGTTGYFIRHDADNPEVYVSAPNDVPEEVHFLAESSPAVKMRPENFRIDL